ncbi:MAG TPA: phosphatidylglycerol lysyltransferase domain-containing protein [Gaiellaceae bacterium]
MAAAAVGAISIASAVTPSLSDRSALVNGVLPPEIPDGARYLALALGIALIWLSFSLARRRRNAWHAAVLVVLVIAAAHLVKGLDAEEAGASLLLLAALVAYRQRFDVPGDPAALRPLAGTAIALAGVVAFLTLYDLDRLAAPDWLDDIVLSAGVFLLLRATYLWLRPLTERVQQTVTERRTARNLVEHYGTDSLAFFSLRRDKNYFISESHRAFLAYRVVAGTALVSGDPIGDASEFEALLTDFLRETRAKGWRPAVLSASEEMLDLYRSLGLRAIEIGREAVVRPDVFSLEGRPIRKVRQSVNRLIREGYSVRALRTAELTPAERAGLDDVSCEWLGAWPERGFTMAMDELFDEPDPVFLIAESSEGRIDGFIQLVPCPAGDGYSLSAMRRRRSTPNGLMEFLVAEAIAWVGGENVAELSLNFCVFGELLGASGGKSRPTRALRFALLKLDRLFQLERLLSFNRKFFPEWRPRFLCFERLTDFPAVGLAYLHAESLLTPPGPWTR